MVENEKINSLADLFKASRPVLIINLITLYRTIAFPVLAALVFLGKLHAFKWLLIVSFLTDAVDGVLARRFKATSVFGARIDSIGDDLTILAALLGLFVFRQDFLREQILLVAVQLGLFFLQLGAAMIRYGRITSFHTYLAKGAAVLQGFFLCSMFLFQQPIYWLFYAASYITILELTEEIIIVAVLREWKANVKGLYWVIFN